MAKKRITRKQLLKEPDEFITVSGKVIGWIKKYPKQLTYGACAFFAVIIFIAAFGYYKENKARQGFSLFSQSLVKYQAEAQNQDPAKGLALVGPDFDRLVTDFQGQPAGRLGQVIYGHISLTGQALDQAIELYQKSLDRFGDDPSLSNIVLNGIASAYEQKQSPAEAIRYFKKIADGTNSAFKDVALFQLGRLYQQIEQPEKSKQAYEQLTASFPDSMYADVAREKLAL